MKKTKVLYLDLDGTVRLGYDEMGKFVNSKNDVVIFDGVKEKLLEYKKNGWRIVGITNQGGVSLGHLTFRDMAEAVEETNKQCDYVFDKIAACIHHPQAEDMEFAICWCRKPRIGNIVETARDMSKEYDEYYPPHLSLFVGDREEDKQCAENAGIPFMWAKNWRDTEPINS